MEENDLFLDYVNNNNEESLKILNKWLPKMVNRIVRDNEKTKEVVQKTWIKIIETKKGFDPERGKIKNRIYIIARNYAIKELNITGNNSNVSDQNILDNLNANNSNPYTILENKEKKYILYKAISKLKTKCQEILNMFLDELSYDDMRELLGISMNTVKMRLYHCKKYLGLEIKRMM